MCFDFTEDLAELEQPVEYPAFTDYELGELLPSVLARMKSLCGKAADAAQSWGNTADKEAATKRKASLSTLNAAMSVEQ
jgi:hypothetical protein